jgi:Trypsin-co-occurring domain 1
MVMFDMNGLPGRGCCPGADVGVGVAAVSRLIPVRVGDIEIEVEAVPVAGTEPTSGRAAKAAGSVLEAFSRAQDAIIAVAKSTAQMIEQAGAAARPDRVEVEFGLKFSVSGGVIMAGVAGEASLKVTLGYDMAARPVAAAPLSAAAPGKPIPGLPAGSS